MTNKTNIWLGILGILILACAIVYAYKSDLKPSVTWDNQMIDTPLDTLDPSYSEGPDTSVSHEAMDQYTSPDGLFSFLYPTKFNVNKTLAKESTEWRSQTDTLTKGDFYFTLTIPKTFEGEKTNFSEAKLTVGSSKTSVALRDCLTSPAGGSVKTEKVTLNGDVFTKIVYSDAAAGNRYDITSYRIVKNKTCYALEYIIHSTNIGNYDPSQNIKEFNAAHVVSALEDIVQTFNFIDPIKGDNAVVPKSATIVGKMTCLPHRDTSGPQTLECASGLAATNGEYYALDVSAYSYPADAFTPSDTIKVTGILVPIEMLSSDMWQRYNIKGIIRVTGITK